MTIEGLNGNLATTLPSNKELRTNNDEENKRDHCTRLELDERKVAAGFLETRLDAIDLLGLGFLVADFDFCDGGGQRGIWGFGFHGLELFGGFVG
nr:hypothetical protein CFP56_15295 [Quercus suber]